MKNYRVKIAFDMPTFMKVGVKAKSQKHAEKIVSDSFDKHGWDSDYFDLQGADWDQEWTDLKNIHVVPKHTPEWESLICDENCNVREYVKKRRRKKQKES